MKCFFNIDFFPKTDLTSHITWSSPLKQALAIIDSSSIRFGRPPIQKPENWDLAIEKYKSGIMSAKQTMAELGLKKTSFYKLLNDEKERNQAPSNT